MNEVIAHATVLINEAIEQLDEHPDIVEEKIKPLIELRDGISNLYNSDLAKTNWSQLFFRRLTRLANYNKSIGYDIWIYLYDDMLYILNKRNAAENAREYTTFLRRMELEGKLEQREVQFNQIYGERKSMNELFQIHRGFLNEYFQTCISLHSMLQVRNIVENADDLLRNTYSQKDITLSCQSEKRLQTTLKCIEIPLECTHRSLQSLSSLSSTSIQQHDTADESEDLFIPWIDQLQYKKISQRRRIQDCLKDHRWFVTLGDPGSAKTTLIRWIVRIFSEAALRGDERVLIEGDDWGPVRVPILIRIGEFAQWREIHQTSTLIDYIGQHTWFSQSYSCNNNGNMLKDFVFNGHSLILLDGLDEISVFEQRSEIAKLVQDFIIEYVRSPDYFAACDDMSWLKPDWIGYDYEMQPPKTNGGNQVIITSRIVGYYLNRLRGPLFKHFSLSPMDTKEKNEFAKNWFLHVNCKIHRIFQSEGIRIDSETMQTLQTRQKSALDKLLLNGNEQLSSYPLTLSLICSSVFMVSDEFPLPRRRIQLYDLVVQSTMRIWTSQQLVISEKVIVEFLTALALYIHLNSSSGLIDEYDMNQLCYFNLKQQVKSNNRTKVHQYTNELVTLLDFNVGIVAERGLQVFSFVHLSFQEYFVARCFAEGSSISKVTERFLSFTINSRFREPLLLALGWISWKWSFIDYDAFCGLLVVPSIEYAIPLGALILFDALDDVQILPSNKVIFTALNSILDHPSRSIVTAYFKKSLSKLHENIIVEWMQSNLINERHLNSFCVCLLSIFIHSKWASPLICQRLWTFHTMSASAEFVIDQTLRQVASSKNELHLVSKDGFPQYLVSHGISTSDIHPLILSVIVALCDGIHFVNEKFDFWPSLTYRNPSILEPFIEYFDDIVSSHTVKIQKLIDQYVFTLRQYSNTDISNDIIDTFIALICLRGVSHPLAYKEFHAYQALPLALNRFKRILFHLRSSYKNVAWIQNKFFLSTSAEIIINTVFSQFPPANRYRLVYSLASVTAWLRLGIWWILRNLQLNVLFQDNIGGYFKSHTEFSCFIKHFFIVSRNNNLIVESEHDRIVNSAHMFRGFENEPFYLLFFVPNGLQLLYFLLIVAPNSPTDSLPFVVLLLECLMFLDGINKHEASFFMVLSILQPLFEKHGLENYTLGLLCEDRPKYISEVQTPQECLDKFDIYLLKNVEILINEERKRIQTVECDMESKKADLKFAVASISLARLFQAQYRIQKRQTQMNNTYTNISVDDSKDIYQTILNISDITMRIIVLSIALDLKDPFIFDEVQSNALRQQIISWLEHLLPTQPLLVSTFLFIRCQSLYQLYPVAFEQFAQVIGQQLVTVPIDEVTHQEHETAYIALRMLHNPLLSSFLLQFENQTMHLANLFELNSTIFHHYFVNTMPLSSMDTVLLSSMYLGELAVDAQILNDYSSIKPQTVVFSSQELENLLTEPNDMITLKTALWITYCLETFNEENIVEIANKVSHFCNIHSNAKSVIIKWLKYRTNGPWKFFAYYAALLLAKEGVILPVSIDRINDLCDIGIDHNFSAIVRSFLELKSIDIALFSHILIAIIRGAHQSCLKSQATVCCNEIMGLLLQLEQERLSANSLDCESFLMVIDGCSLEVQDYLAQHLHRIISEQSVMHITNKEKYLDVLSRWIIHNSRNKSPHEISSDLCDCVFELLQDQRFPRVQKKVASYLKIVFDDDESEGILKTENTQIHLENVICSCLNSSDICAEDLLAVCLLTYGNCVVFLRREDKGGNISSEMSSILNILFETSSSRIISARAGLCLFFSNLNVNYVSLLDWLNKEVNMTFEKAYDVLIQRMVLHRSNWNTPDSSNEFFYEYDVGVVINSSIPDLFKLILTYPA